MAAPKVLVTDQSPQNLPTPPVTPDEVPTPNPLEGLGVNVFIPDLEVRMVNASALEDYEIWFGTTSVLVAAAVGFFAAYIQSSEPNASGHGTHHESTLLIVMFLFLAFSIGGAARTFILRARIKRKSRSYAMQVTSQ
jgi:hypothetical protein